MKARYIVAGTVGTAVVGAVVTGAMAAAAAPPRPEAAPSLPPPRFGRTLDIGLVSGVVMVTPPGRRPFKLGVQDRNIPIASLIDTTHGRVDLRAAPPASTAGAAAARVEDAQLYDGAFRGSASRGRTHSRKSVLREARSSRAPHRRGTRSMARLPHRVVRLLHASASGRFQTDGRYAAATVRGTIWLTEDFCDGTLVRVTRGVVAVENLVTGAAVTVRGGHSYFASAPG